MSSSDSKMPLNGEVLTSSSERKGKENSDKTLPPNSSWKPAKTSSKADNAESSTAKKNSRVESESAKKTSSSKFKQWMNSVLISSTKWLAMAAVIIAAVLYLRPDQDWQIDKINQLQQTSQTLQNQIAELESKLEQQSNKQSIQSESLVALENALAKQTSTQTIPQLSEISTDNWVKKDTLAKLEAQIQNQWQGFETQVNSVIEQVNQTISELKQTTPSNEMTSSVESIETPEVANNEAELPTPNMQTPPNLQASSNNPLSSIQLQQWLLAINNQWMVSANVEATKEQLFAIEASSGLSDFKDKSLLSRSIGKDLAYLEQFEGQQQSVPDLSDLKNYVVSLNVTDHKSSTQVLTESELSQQEVSSSWQTLLDQMTQVVRIQKREDADVQTRVESILLEDILRQRALLFVDRMEWALSSQNALQLTQSVESLQNFLNKYFVIDKRELEAQLSPVQTFEFVVPKSLVIANMHFTQRY